MLNLLSTITAGNTLFLAFLVYFVRHDTNVSANRWLSVFLLILGIFLLDQSLYVFPIYEQYPQLMSWFSLPTFALGPCMYMVVSHYVEISRPFKWRECLHFAPFFIFILLNLPFLAEEEAAIAQAQTETGHGSVVVFMALLLSQILAYWIAAYRKLARHRTSIENLSAAPETVNLDWLRHSLIGILLMVVVWVFELIFVPDFYTDATWGVPFYLAGICFIGYHALRQREVFPYSTQSAEEITEIIAVQHATAAQASKLYFTTAQVEQLKHDLHERMLAGKHYLDQELSLSELARASGLRTHELSQLINEGFGENFYQFVNRYRVDASKQLLQSDKHRHLSMVGIAYEAGFNSKTAFNTAFKKHTGLTPSEFQKKHPHHSSQVFV